MALKDLIIQPEPGALEAIERAYDVATHYSELFKNVVFNSREFWQHLASEGWDVCALPPPPEGPPDG